MTKLILLAILITSFIKTQAQIIIKGTISGKVTNENHIPIPGATVELTGPNLATLTDEQGNYLLKVPAGSYKLSAKSLGHLTAETQVRVPANQNVQNTLILIETSESLEDVTISGVKVKTATATRSLLPIQDIPQSIAVIGQRVIKQQAAIDLSTITRNISGLNFTGNYSGAGSAQFFNARGFDLNDSQSYRLNGKMIWNLGNNYSDNIEQVEFLKGPTSVLFGDVSPGGIMNFVTKKPLPDFMAELNFKTGSWGLIRPALDITGPLTKDRSLRFRLNTSMEKAGSFRDYVSSERQFIAPTLAWNISPALSLNLETIFKHSSSVDDAGLVSPDGTIAGLKKLRPSLYLGEPSRKYQYSDQSYYAVLNYELNKSWRLKVTGFYAHTGNRPFGLWFEQPDSAGNFARNAYGYHQISKNASVSVEALGSFYTGSIKHNVLFGAEYFSTSYRYTNSGSLTPLDSNNIYHPLYGQTGTGEPFEDPFQPYVSRIRRSGINFQDQMLFWNEKLHFLLGFRIGRTEQGNHYFQDQAAGTEYEGYRDDIIAKNVFTPRLGLVYKIKPWSSLYVSYSKGYEVNSPDIFARNYKQYSTPPATISTQLEIGAKANLFSDRLGLSLSVFQINKDKPYGYVYLNPEMPNYDEYDVYYAGHHRSRGIELDADGKISPSFSLTAAAAYTHTRVTQDPGYPDGNLLPNAPKVTGNFWLNFEPKQSWKGLSLGTGFFYKDKFFSSLANNPNFEIPWSYTIDAAIGYTYKNVGAQLNVMNITNQISYLNPWQFNLFDVRPPRQFILTLTYKIR
jgi:iron complex outermembrane receptor protein